MSDYDELLRLEHLCKQEAGKIAAWLDRHVECIEPVECMQLEHEKLRVRMEFRTRRAKESLALQAMRVGDDFLQRAVARFFLQHGLERHLQ